jgi:WD40 repeat protein
MNTLGLSCLLVLPALTQPAPAVVTLRGHGMAVWAVAFSPDGTLLASASSDRTVKVWEVAAGKEKFTLKGHANFVTCVAFSPDGATLASGGYDATVRLWDVATGAERVVLKKGRALVGALAFSPDGKLLAWGGTDGAVRLWDVAAAKERPPLRGHGDAVTALAFAPDGSLLASGGDDRTIKLWDVPSRTEVATLTGHGKGVTGLAFSADGGTLASVGLDRRVKLWSVPLLRAVREWPRRGLAALGGCPEAVQRDGPLARTLTGHQEWVTAVACRPDGKLLATAGGEFVKAGHVKLWRLADGKAVLSLEQAAGPARGVAFDRGGKYLACAAGQAVCVWELPPLP